MAGRQTQILIIHQNFSMAKTLARLLAKDFGVYIARETGQVPEILETQDIQMVIFGQQFSDHTGLTFLFSLSKSHPKIIRVLLLPRNSVDEKSAEQAMIEGLIHFYMAEPLSSAGFVDMIQAGVRLYQGEEPVKTVEAHKVGADAEEGEVLLGLEDVIYSDAQKVEEASRSIGRVSAEQGMKEEFDRVCAKKDERIEKLEGSCAHLRQERDSLQSQLLRISEENAALASVRSEREDLARVCAEKDERIEQIEASCAHLTEERDALQTQLLRMSEENAALASVVRNEKEEFDRVCAKKDERIEQIEASCTHLTEERDALQTQLLRMSEENAVLASVRNENLEHLQTIATLESEHASLFNQLTSVNAQLEDLKDELQAARKRLESFGIMDDMAVEWNQHYGMGSLPGPDDIYERAAEWLNHIHQLHRINNSFTVKIRRGEQEIEELYGQIEQDQDAHNEELGRLKRQIREYQDVLSQLQERAAEQEKLCNRLLREKKDLAQKLDWMQSHWKEAAGIASVE